MSILERIFYFAFTNYVMGNGFSHIALGSCGSPVALAETQVTFSMTMRYLGPTDFQ